MARRCGQYQVLFGGINAGSANRVTTLWLLRTFGDSGELKRNGHERGEGGTLETIVNEWRNEPLFRDYLGHQLAFTKSTQEPNGIKLGKAKRGGSSKFRYLQFNKFAISTLFRA